MPSPTLAPRPMSAAKAPPFAFDGPASSASKELIPASSLIRSILKRSRRVFCGGPLGPGLELPDSLLSSNRLSINSGLLPIVFIEEAVLRRSSAEAGAGGAEAASLLPDVCLESHENGPVNFRDGGVGVGMVCFEEAGPEGGGPHGIEDKEPESPCERKGSFGGGSAGCAVSSVEVVSIERDLGELSLLFPSRCTSSREVIEIRCAVSKGDFR